MCTSSFPLGHDPKYQVHRPGDKLVGRRCQLCSSETGELGALAAEVLVMVDVAERRGAKTRAISLDRF